MGSKAIAVKTTRECPLGRDTPPLKGSLIVDKLLWGLTDLGISCPENAYDIVIYANGKFESILCGIIQRGLINLTRKMVSVSVT